MATPAELTAGLERRGVLFDVMLDHFLLEVVAFVLVLGALQLLLEEAGLSVEEGPILNGQVFILLHEPAKIGLQLSV